MDKNDFNEGLLGFLDASPTPFHATNNMSMMFENAGFIKLYEDQKWNLEHGKKYYVTRNDSSIIAFTYPQRKNYTMVGAHTDSPNLKLKPNPVIKEHGVVKFGVEPYGGLLLNPWFDRDLSLAGRVSYLNSQNIIKDALINVEKAVAIIPSLAIHLDDKANKDRTINKQTDMCPILTTNDDFDFEDFLKWQLSKLDVLDVKELYIPPRISWWLTSVDDNQSVQLLNRQFGGTIDETAKQDDDVFQSQVSSAITGECALPENKDVEICRCIIDDVKQQLCTVVVPYAGGLEWRNKTNRRNFPIFIDIIKAFAILRHRQRYRQ